MENQLVFLVKNRAVCTSLQIAEKFDKRHDSVLRSIDDVISDMDSETAKLWFQKTTYKSKGNNKSYPMYNMNRDGFSIVAMGFTGKRALEWKVKYIKAFNRMEEFIETRSSEGWIQTREQGKITRKAETEKLSGLVEYARKQGYDHDDRWIYTNYTKLANKICGISKRDNATIEQLSNLTVAENIILHCVQIGIEEEKHYKDIYQDCKKRLEMFKDIAYLEVA